MTDAERQRRRRKRLRREKKEAKKELARQKNQQKNIERGGNRPRQNGRRDNPAAGYGGGWACRELTHEVGYSDDEVLGLLEQIEGIARERGLIQ
jgi:hypothetical protein